MKGFGSGKQRSPAVQIVEVRPQPAQAVCSECGQAYPVNSQVSEAEWICPRCGPSVRLDLAAWRHRPHVTSQRRIWRQLPLFAVLMVVSLLPLLTFILLQLVQLRRPDTEQTLLEPLRAAQTAGATGVLKAAVPDTDPFAETPQDNLDPQELTTDASSSTEARSDQDGGQLPLSRLLQAPGTPPEEDLRLGCRFVRTIAPNPSWRLGLTEGEVQRPTYRIEVVDAAGQTVSQSFVAPGSQAERVVPWLMEGDWLEVVGTIVIRLDRPTRPAILGFLIREIRPADRQEALRPAA